MSDDENPYSTERIAQQRLTDLLERLSQQGHSQQEVAADAGLPAQYLSDIKHGRRPMTELVARRLGDAFQVNFQWLTVQSDSMEPDQESSSLSNPDSGGTWLPLFPHPVEGEPRSSPAWDGSCVEISGPAAAKLVLTKWPYVLRFGHNDIRKRLCRGDLVLISQTIFDEAEFSVVRYRKKSFLARLQPDGSWERAAYGDSLPGTCPVIGHAVGIVWASLLSRLSLSS